MVKPILLIILDGWGLAPAGPGNAISLAKTPNINKYWAAYPKTQLEASGPAVGLPRGEVGNSETGHINLGAGQIIYQDLPKIDLAIADGSFFQNYAFLKASSFVKKNNSKLHLLGLIGSGGVHSHLEHLFALLRFARNQSLENVYLHLITDGRDSAPTSAPTYLQKIDEQLIKYKIGKIATICGRYFALDRDNRWERTQKAYQLLTQGNGKIFSSAQEALNQSYKNGITDEFIEPTLLDKNGLITNGDGIIFFNFRIDRPRQLTKALVLPDFERATATKTTFDPYAERYGLHVYDTPRVTTTFKREVILSNILFVTITEYEQGLPVEVAFPPQEVKMPLSRILSNNNWRQLRLSESEKERFVGYYFDGLKESPFPLEDRLIIPSVKIETYDKKPEMSAYEITKEAISCLEKKYYDFMVINLANPDMIGHTGNLQAGIKACEVVDECLGKIVNLMLNLGGVILITADHGNIEEMINHITGKIDTEHSCNPVPFIVVSQNLNLGNKNLPTGTLADVAPTILALSGLDKPSIMTGRSLLGKI